MAEEEQKRKELVFGGHRMTFADGYEEYMQATAREMKDRTRDSYKKIWERVEAVLGHLLLREVDTRAMDALKKALPARLGPKTANNHLRLVSGVLGFLFKRKLIEVVPHIPTLPVPKKHLPWYTEWERDRLLAGIFRTRPQWYLFFYLTTWLGTRAGEVYGITKTQVLSAPHRLVVDRAVQRGTKERPAKIVVRKNDDCYELGLTQDVVDAITWHIDEGFAGATYLFSKDGKFPRYIDSHVGPLQTVQRQLGLRVLSHHRLGRHSVASQAASSGETAKTIQHQLGHKSEASTHKYIHLSSKAQLRLVSNLRPEAPPHVVKGEMSETQGNETKTGTYRRSRKCLKSFGSGAWI